MLDGLDFKSSPLPMSQKDIKNICAVMGDGGQLHLSEKHAKDSFFGHVIVPGAYITTLAIKTMWEMRAATNIFPDCQVINLNVVAKYIKPVKASDSLVYEWKALGHGDKKLKGTDSYAVTWEILAKNQDQDLVAMHVWKFAYI